jgi:hypothetical protein
MQGRVAGAGLGLDEGRLPPLLTDVKVGSTTTPTARLVDSGVEEGLVMDRKFGAVVLPLAVLAVVSPTVAASPPEKVAGVMTFDAVANGLRKYAKETDQAKRIRSLEKLAPTGDPRVAIALWETQFSFTDETPEDEKRLRAKIGDLLDHYFVSGTRFHHVDEGGGQLFETGAWWDATEADLRRRAARLPR